MLKKTDISSLFDRSGNLTAETMVRYLQGKLNQQEYPAVARHLEESPFDREALEGFQKHRMDHLPEDVSLLNEKIERKFRNSTGGSKSRPLQKKYWIAAASFIIITGISILLIIISKQPIESNQLAVIPPDTAENSKADPIQKEVKVIVKENVNPPVIKPVKKITIVEDDADIVAEELIVIHKEMGDVKDFNDSILDEFPIEQEMVQEEIQIFLVVEKMPEFPGGEEKFNQFLADSLKYPELARESGIQGRVFVTFVVEKDGSVSDARVLRGIGGGCDEEALRVINLMPRWNPGRQRGQPVRVQYNLPIKFTLE